MGYSGPNLANMANVIPYDYVIYKSGTTTYAWAASTGTIKYTGTDIGVILNSCIDSLTAGGRIYIGPGTYSLSTAVDFDNKTMIIEGSGIGSRAPYTTPGCYIVPTGGFTGFCFQNTTPGGGVVAFYSQIRNICIDGAGTTAALGAIQWKDIWLGVIENCYIYRFYATLASQGFDAIGIDCETTSGSYGAYYNRFINNYIGNCTLGIKLGIKANANQVRGGNIFNNRASIIKKGIYVLGSDTHSFAEIDMNSYDEANCYAMHIAYDAGGNNGMIRVIGSRFEANLNDIYIDNLQCRCMLIGNMHTSAVGGHVAVTDNNASVQNKALIMCDSGWRNEAWGSGTGNGAQQTIAHTLKSTPTVAIVGDYDSGANSYISAASDATNIYVTAVNAKKYYYFCKF